MRRRARKPGAYGPYPHGNRYRVLVVDERGRGTAQSYATEAEALKVLRSCRRQLNAGQKTIEEAVNAYEVHQREKKENKVRSIACTIGRIRSFFTDDGERPVISLDDSLTTLTPALCGQLYEQLTKRLTRFGRKMSADSHRNMLIECRSFLRWCIEQGWMKTNPLEGVKGQGRRKHGKPQLRIDESRKWLATAHEMIDDALTQPKPGRKLEGPASAMTVFLLGTRCEETVRRKVRDLDDGGRLLWIEDTKSPAGRRTLLVPEELRPYLKRLADGRKPTDLLFGRHDRAFPRRWVKRICTAAKVPVVVAHAMRGLQATLSIIGGFDVRATADKLGHEEESTTLTSYANREQIAQAKQLAALRVLESRA